MRYQQKLVNFAKQHGYTVREEASVRDGWPMYKVIISGMKNADGQIMQLSQSNQSRREAYKRLYKVAITFAKSNRTIYSPDSEEFGTIDTGPK